MGIFTTNTVTIRRTHPINGQLLGQHLPVQMDVKTPDWQMEAQGLAPIHIYDCQTIGWTQPALQQSDYLIDEKTGEAYSVRSEVYLGVNNLQFEATRYGGVTP